MSSLSPTSTPHTKYRLAYRLYINLMFFQSRKLQSLRGRARIEGVISLMTLARSFMLYVEYHFASRTLPCRLIKMTKCICAGETAVVKLFPSSKGVGEDHFSSPSSYVSELGPPRWEPQCTAICQARVEGN